jgi:hypothetical protein
MNPKRLGIDRTNRELLKMREYWDIAEATA